MGRPRENEELKLTVVQRGSKFYAYRNTSISVDGKKHSISEYIGTYDPKTGEVIPKKPGKTKAEKQKVADERAIAVIKDIEVLDFGAVYLMDRIQRRIHIGDDLNAAFGSISVTILATSMTLVMTGGVFDAVEPMMKRTWIKRMYGISGSLDSGSLSKITKKIGAFHRANIERYFELRIRRVSGMIAFDTTTKGTNSTMEGMAEYVVNNKDNEDLRQVKIGFATDMRGIPLMYRIYCGNVSDMDTLRLMTDDITRMGGKDFFFVVDRGFLSGWNIHHMLSNRYRFVIPGKIEIKAIGKLITAARKSNECVDKEFLDRIYTVYTSELGVVKSDTRKVVSGEAAYDFTVPGDKRHDESEKLRAYVCFDVKKYSDEVQAHKKLIYDLKKFAEKMDSPNPVQAFKKKAGKASTYFNIEADGRRVKLTERPKSLSFEVNRAGYFVLLTTEDITWESAMIAYDARRLTEQAYDCNKGESPRFGTSDRASMEGREFMRFVDLTIRCEMIAEIREKNMEHRLSVEGALAQANCIQIRTYEDVKVIAEIDKAQRAIFDLFDVPVPQEADTDLPIITSESVPDTLLP